jgi:hypothetical protein
MLVYDPCVELHQNKGLCMAGIKLAHNYNIRPTLLSVFKSNHDMMKTHMLRHVMYLISGGTNPCINVSGCSEVYVLSCASGIYSTPLLLQ